MDDSSQKLIEDCFLRPICNAKSTNSTIEPTPSKIPLKTELQVLRLSDESQNIIMETLRSIHGDDFKLDDQSKYKDRGTKMKKSYWEDSGSLIVQSVANYAVQDANIDDPLDRLQRFAIVKLENYGFPTSHCIEALQHCEWSSDEALMLLFNKYMKVSDFQGNENSIDLSEESLLEMREDEKLALESIYDTAFEQKERNHIWSLKFKIDHLLVHSPSEEKKKQKSLESAANNSKDSKQKPKCRNFAKGHCKFGSNCRFSHAVVEVVDGRKEHAHFGSDESDEKWFYLEIRFPPSSKYPYEAPYIFLKTTCHDIPRHVLLKISRKLYRQALDITADGMPCVYSVSELLQMDESMSNCIKDDREPFLNPEKSLFHQETNNGMENDATPSIPLPSHYEMGQLGRSDGSNISAEQILREDRALVKKFLDRQTNEKYRKMLAVRRNLPAFSKMSEILKLIESEQVLVISGETGCGKSTQVPQFILDQWLLESSMLGKDDKPSHVEIICTQPRRLSAIAVAERVADERAERVGLTIGYQIRLENKISSATRLTFCTTGILLRRLASDPFLSALSHIVVDEVHERSEESDFLLLILKKILKKRKDLKVILMSATLNANLFSDYFGGVPVLDIPGRTFPVQQLFLEDILDVIDYVMEADSQYSRKIKKKEEDELMRELEYSDVQAMSEPPPKNIKDEHLNLAAINARYRDYSKRTCKTIFLSEPMKINPELIESVLKYIVEGDHDWSREGSILVFLPGLQEIQAVHDALCDSHMFGRRSSFLLLPLHSTLTSEEQSLIFRPAPTGQRKIILSTNIAETSVTIDDCVFVVDCGLMKEKRFDSNRNMESLELVWESRANAMQRKGRAGRVMPGVCIHLFTGHRFKNNILSQPVPEIHRVPLEQLVLRIKTLPNFEGHKVVEVLGQTLEPPTEENIITAVTRLQDLGALNEDHSLTALGHHLSALPVDVRIGKLMLFGAIFQCLDSVLTIAASLSHKSPFVSPFGKKFEADKKKMEFAICNSDHLTCLLAYKKWLDVSKRNRRAGQNFAEENYLSTKTLQTISEVKYQLLELLVSIGFVPIDVPRKRKNAEDNILALTGHDLNINGEKNGLLVSLLCAALYPNVVKILTPEKTYIQTAAGAMPKIANARDLRYKTRLDGYVSIHPSSVNSKSATFLSPFMVYQEKVKTSKIYIRECTMIPLVPLILFAGSDLRIELHGGDFLFLLEDGWIILKAHNHDTAEMIQCLRVELFKLLEEKIKDPCLNLLNHENGKKIIQAIVHLITK